MKKKRNQGNLLDYWENRAFEVLKRSIYLNIKFFNQIFLEMMEAQEDYEHRIQEFQSAIRKYKSGKIDKIREKLFVSEGRYKDMQKVYEEVLKQQEEFIADFDKNIKNLESEHFLTESDKKWIKVYKDTKKDAEKLYAGLLGKSKDFFSGRLKVIIKAEKGDTKAKEHILNDLKEFNKKIKKQLRYFKLQDSDIYICMYNAILKWRDSKYMGYLDWIKYLIKTQVKRLQTDELKEKSKIISNIDPEVFDKINSSEDERIVFTKRSKIADILWIEQAAEFIGISAQTLRNWDKGGVFKARRTNKKGKSYRIYYWEDIPKLRKIKSENKRKRKHCLKGYLKITDVAKELKISTKTIKRMEKSGKLSRIKRDNVGHRIFTHKDITKIKTLLNK